MHVAHTYVTDILRNLSFDTDEDDLHDMFSEFGDINYCKIVVNQQTGLSKGTGFIQFKSNETAQSCITAANRADGKVSNIIMYVHAGIAVFCKVVPVTM